MPNVLQIASLAGAAGSAGFGASSTTYILLTGRSTVSATESQVQRVVRSAGTFSNMSVLIISNDRGASTLTFRKDTGGGPAAGNQTISIPSSTTGRFEDITNSDTVAAGDKVNMRIVVGAGGTTCVARVYSSLFSASSGNVVTLPTASSQNNMTTASTTVFTPITGEGTDAAEALVQEKVKTAGTWRNLAINVRTNTFGTTCTVRSRKNTANGNQVISVTASTTGWFEDISNSDTVAVDDLLSLSMTTGSGAGNFRLWCAATEFDSSAGNALALAASGATYTTVAASGSIYGCIGGFGNCTDATEAYVQTTAGAIFTASFVGCNVVANTVVGASSLQLRKNATTNLNNVVSITGLTTGWFVDVTHSDSIVATDTLGYLVTAGAAGTNMSIGHYSMLMSFTSSVALAGTAVSSQRLGPVALTSSVALAGVARECERLLGLTVTSSVALTGKARTVERLGPVSLTSSIGLAGKARASARLRDLAVSVGTPIYGFLRSGARANGVTMTSSVAMLGKARSNARLLGLSLPFAATETASLGGLLQTRPVLGGLVSTRSVLSGRVFILPG